MRTGIKLVVAVVLWLVPLAAHGQDKTSAEAQKLAITVMPTEKGCSVALSSKVGKALGTPEGLGTPTLGESGKEPLPSLITCTCGTASESKECPQGGTCACGAPRERPSVVCK